MTTYTVTDNGERIDFDSPISDREALIRLHHWTRADGPFAKNLFACSLADSLALHGKLSPRQISWVHYMIMEWMKNEAERVTRKESAAHNFSKPIQYKTIARLLRSAQARDIHSPVIRGESFKVRLQTSRQGVLYIAVISNKNEYLGKLSDCGVTDSRTRFNDDTLRALDTLNRNPLEHARGYGRKTSNCCFCKKHLETSESVSAGYGPVCAAHWGLPWGAVSNVATA